jgi:hypothetical protein
MTTPYTNPYTAQLYPDYLNAADGPIPLPPDPNAYSVGPGNDGTAIAVAWSSYQFSASTTTNLSKSTMIKDDADVFYVASAYCPSSTLTVRVNVYDAENDTATTYDITPPTELANLKTTYGATSVRSWTWMLRKSSSTTLDLIVRYYDGGVAGDYIYQHYTWTIGDATMTYAGGMTWNNATYGDSQMLILHGPLVIDFSNNGWVCTVHTYNLDTATAGSPYTAFDPAAEEGTLIAYNVGFWHAGALVHFVKFVSKETATGGGCSQVPAGTRDPRQEAKLYFGGDYWDLDGVRHGHGSSQVDQVSMHDCSIDSIGIESRVCGVIPSAGAVYFRMYYVRAWSDTTCPTDPYLLGVAGTPDHTETIWQVCRVSGGGYSAATMGALDYEFLPVTEIPRGPDWWNYPSHTDPMSRIYEAPSTYYLYRWKTQTKTFQDDSLLPTVGSSGQLNDNSPAVFNVATKPGTYYHNLCYTSAGSLYLDQESTWSINALMFPVTGYMGKWPVRHYRGRWAVFGPNTPPPALPRWQVV